MGCGGGGGRVRVSGRGGGRGSADVNHELKVFTLQEMCCGFFFSSLEN